MRIGNFLTLLAVNFTFFANSHAQQLPIQEKWMRANNKALEVLRSSKGLIKDTVSYIEKTPGKWEGVVMSHISSPTNLALDLILQLDDYSTSEELNPEKTVALEKIKGILKGLERLPFDQDTGLFYGWYNIENQSVASENLSSVDNLHLSLALWTATQVLPEGAEKDAALRLFSRQDFSIFYDSEKELLAGNLILQNDGVWKSEGYVYSHFGSEARSIYILGYALGLFKKLNDSWIYSSLNKLTIEQSSENDGYRLKLWDGGAFQMFLPDLLINERSYSPTMQRMFQKYGQRMVLRSQNVTELFSLPAAFSACFLKDDNQNFIYNGQAGLLSETSQLNNRTKDPHSQSLWESAFTPHALFLAMNDLEEQEWKKLKQLEDLRDGSLNFFSEEYGWLDSWQYGSSNKDQNKIVNLQVSLDQLLSILSLRRSISKDKKIVTARALENNQAVRIRLEKFYKNLNNKIFGLKLEEF